MKFALLILIFATALAGCTTKSKSKKDARAAFMAGQNSAMRAMPQGLTVSISGPVQNHVVQWTEELTLAKAIVIAEYQEQRNPREILIRRGGEEFRIHPNALLKGEDIPLQPRDEITINP